MHPVPGVDSAQQQTAKRVEAFFRRSKRCGMSPPELWTFDELCQQSDTKLFRNILSDSSHVLHKLLPHDQLLLKTIILGKDLTTESSQPAELA